MRIAVVFGVLLLAVACGTEPCDQYVDYMCDCHPEVDCAELRNTYNDASSAVQDECASELNEQESADDGECGASDTDAT